MIIRETGFYKNLGETKHFIPYSLPPSNPEFKINNDIISLYGEASFALGQLNEMSLRLPNIKRFIKAYVIKEALLSSSIEGINTSIIDVFTNPLGQSKPNENTQLVLNYTHALDSSLNMLKKQNIPLSSRVILKAHKMLMDGQSSPGMFRKQSVSVGKLTPPPATEINNLMSSLEKYINEKSEIPPLIRAGLVHINFETIHPFLDGNGRIGRLLIVLMLIDNDILKQPIIYPSYYFKKHYIEYYSKLDLVRTKGDFEGWISYYLKAINESALDAYNRAKEIEVLEKKLNNLVQNDIKFLKTREISKLALNFLFEQPVTNISDMSQSLGKAYNTIKNILKIFLQLEIVMENTTNKRNKLYTFKPYIHILEKEY